MLPGNSNLAVSTRAFVRRGGWKPLRCDERSLPGVPKRPRWRRLLMAAVRAARIASVVGWGSSPIGGSHEQCRHDRPLWTAHGVSARNIGKENRKLAVSGWTRATRPSRIPPGTHTMPTRPGRSAFGLRRSRRSRGTPRARIVAATPRRGSHRTSGWRSAVCSAEIGHSFESPGTKGGHAAHGHAPTVAMGSSRPIQASLSTVLARPVMCVRER